MAADLMTSPAVTVTPDDTVDYAARLMYSREAQAPARGGRGRPPRRDRQPDHNSPSSTDGWGDPHGDHEPGDPRSLGAELVLGTGEDGVVTLEGTPETVGIGHDIVARARHVQGVVAVRDRLVYPVPPVPSRPGLHF